MKDQVRFILLRNKRNENIYHTAVVAWCQTFFWIDVWRTYAPSPPSSVGRRGGGTKRGRVWEEGVRKQIITPGPRSRGGGGIQVSMCR